MSTSGERSTAESGMLATLGAMDRADFVARLGHVFEHSPWVAERCWDRRPFASLEALHRAMVDAVRDAGREQQMALIRAHPELGAGTRSSGALSAPSRQEQTSAGLIWRDDAEDARLRALNAAYRQRFGFPFIMAVRGCTRGEILAALEKRLAGDPESEFARALAEIAQIAYFRLDSLVGTQA